MDTLKQVENFLSHIDEQDNLRRENERLRQRVEELEGWLRASLFFVEQLTTADTTEARKALGGE